MKFCKNLLHVVELSDPEWGPFWINYKYLKRKIKEVQICHQESDSADSSITAHPLHEVEFFKSLKAELKKTSDFFAHGETIYKIRFSRIFDGYSRLKENGIIFDKHTWSRLLRACVKFYKDILLLENFAIMNYCGFSKILKKHDKMTGFRTRDAFMRNVMSQQNFSDYPVVMGLLKKSEALFREIQAMDSVMPLQDEERLFIDAIRNLNQQAMNMQVEENKNGDLPAHPGTGTIMGDDTNAYDDDSSVSTGADELVDGRDSSRSRSDSIGLENIYTESFIRKFHSPTMEHFAEVKTRVNVPFPVNMPPHSSPSQSSPQLPRHKLAETSCCLDILQAASIAAAHTHDELHSSSTYHDSVRDAISWVHSVSMPSAATAIPDKKVEQPKKPALKRRKSESITTEKCAPTPPAVELNGVSTRQRRAR